ncbi:HlyU family transcriptional regulator [Limoniibacter endophyticus]|uniref:Transcriptional activator HlyU n=1 Tax=Limoniibacter endophyticus TaxID=1565040 RepID=A0A8J3GGL1_9HYPH|nr:HlyU family transcriptional regulator [Limoniibacter endophyticus]GHC66041.1 hypothetical protein GCM10010136_09170 [Limoniibacter endophyticus]
MSFLKRLFGGGEAKPAALKEHRGDPVEYNGFTIIPTPFNEGGQHQVCALITKEVSGEMKKHRLIRADKFPSLDDAIAVSTRKAQQMIDEQGESIFR